MEHPALSHYLDRYKCTVQDLHKKVGMNEKDVFAIFFGKPTANQMQEFGLKTGLGQKAETE